MVDIKFLNVDPRFFSMSQRERLVEVLDSCESCYYFQNNDQGPNFVNANKAIAFRNNAMVGVALSYANARDRRDESTATQKEANRLGSMFHACLDCDGSKPAMMDLYQAKNKSK